MNLKIKPDYLGISLAALFVVAGCLALYLKNEDVAIALFGAAAGGAFLPPAARKKAAEALLPAVVFAIPMGLAVQLAYSCGGASNETRLSIVAEAKRCFDNQQAILQRPVSSDEKEAALRAEIARCDAMLNAIEGVDGGAP